MTVAAGATRFVVDTNVLVYAYDAAEDRKREVARTLLRRLGRAGEAALPAQALAEFSNVTLRRLRPALPVSVVLAEVDRLEGAFPVLP